jgi:hypothetical protein
MNRLPVIRTLLEKRKRQFEGQLKELGGSDVSPQAKILRICDSFIHDICRQLEGEGDSRDFSKIMRSSLSTLKNKLENTKPMIDANDETGEHEGTRELQITANVGLSIAKVRNLLNTLTNKEISTPDVVYSKLIASQTEEWSDISITWYKGIHQKVKELIDKMLAEHVRKAHASSEFKAAAKYFNFRSPLVLMCIVWQSTRYWTRLSSKQASS